MDRFYITAKGELYAAKTLTGMKLEFTRGKFGSGTPSGSISEMTDLVNPIGQMPISKKTIAGTTAIIQTLFSNYDDDEGTLIDPFPLNEMGLFARLLNADGTVNNNYPETMFGYCYEQDGGQTISQLTEFVFNWASTVSDASNVTVQMSGEMWATKEELEEGLNGKADTSHEHTISDVTDLSIALSGKAAFSHSHTISEVTNLQTTLNGKASTSHTHSDLAPKDSPTFTGTPKAPTPTSGDNSKQIATTAFVKNIAQPSYSWNTPVQIGKLNNTPIWRVLIYEEFETGWTNGIKTITLPIKDLNNAFVISAQITAMSGSPNYVDDDVAVYVGNGDIEYPRYHASGTTSYEGIYGVVEFVTPTNNLNS